VLARVMCFHMLCCSQLPHAVLFFGHAK
jgi:hypothetical protein